MKNWKLAFGLAFFSVIFFAYQNFSELGIQSVDGQYQIIELKPLSQIHPESVAFALNSKNEAFGKSRADDSQWHAVRWNTNGEVFDLGIEDQEVNFSPKGVRISPRTIEFGKRDGNCRGECKILGELGEEVRIVHKTQDTLIQIRNKNDLLMEPNLQVRSVNTYVQSVGQMKTEKAQVAFAFRGGKSVALSSDESIAHDINDLGQIVGEEGKGQSARPTLWSVVGQTPTRLFLFEEAWLTGRAHSINNVGEVVGTLRGRPFIWSPQKRAMDLNSITITAEDSNPHREWNLLEAKSINNCSYIIASGNKTLSQQITNVILKPLTRKPGC